MLFKHKIWSNICHNVFVECLIVLVAHVSMSVNPDVDVVVIHLMFLSACILLMSELSL